MNKLNFSQYNKEAEIYGGDYWKFLDATSESLIKENISFFKIGKILDKITNLELKKKMKEKIFSLIMEKGIYFSGLEFNLDIFDDEERKLLLEHEFDTGIIKYVLNEENIRYYSSDIIYFLDLFENIDDYKWKYYMISNFLNIIKDYNDKSLLIKVIESKKDNIEMYYSLINEYSNYFPVQYKRFLEMNKDYNYIYNKSLKFMDEDIDIGIDPKIKIAPEIEANNDYGIQIELYGQRGFEDYVVSKDATVPNGNEIYPSYPFHNVKEDVAKFCGLCETMKDIGYYYSEESQNAAGQINLGLDYLDTKEAILNFYEIYGNCEELLYYISSEEGQLFRQDVYVNSRIKAISEIIGIRIYDEELSRQDIIDLFNNKRYGEDKAIEGLNFKKNSVCLRGTNENDYRLEFRIPNGGCNYRTWIDNIRLYGRMMEISKKLADMMKKDYLSYEEEELLRLKIDLQDNSLSIKEKLIMLMDLLFKDESIKQIYYNRYTSTIKKIKDTNSIKYMNIYDRTEPSFDEVGFVRHYHSRFEPEYTGEGVVVEYDPEYGMIENKRRK